MKARDALIYAGAGFGLYVAYRAYQKGVGGVASDIGGAVVDAITGLVSGVFGAVPSVVNPASSNNVFFRLSNWPLELGIVPGTNEKSWGGVIGDLVYPLDDGVDTALAEAQRNAQLYGGSVKGWLGYSYVDTDPVNLRGSGLPSASKYGTQTAVGWPWER